MTLTCLPMSKCFVKSKMANSYEPSKPAVSLNDKATCLLRGSTDSTASTASSIAILRATSYTAAGILDVNQTRLQFLVNRQGCSRKSFYYIVGKFFTCNSVTKKIYTSTIQFGWSITRYGLKLTKK